MSLTYAWMCAGWRWRCWSPAEEEILLPGWFERDREPEPEMAARVCEEHRPGVLLDEHPCLRSVSLTPRRPVHRASASAISAPSSAIAPGSTAASMRGTARQEFLSLAA